MGEIPDEELRRQILSFLQDFKELICQGNYYIKNHIKNRQALESLGITARQRDECILSIAFEDYSSGPRPDDYHPGVYWVFGKFLDKTEIYIKLKILTMSSGGEQALCISFHPAEYPLTYPYKKRR